MKAVSRTWNVQTFQVVYFWGSTLLPLILGLSACSSEEQVHTMLYVPDTAEPGVISTQRGELSNNHNIIPPTNVEELSSVPTESREEVQSEQNLISEQSMGDRVHAPQLFSDDMLIAKKKEFTQALVKKPIQIPSWYYFFKGGDLDDESLYSLDNLARVSSDDSGIIQIEFGYQKNEVPHFIPGVAFDMTLHTAYESGVNRFTLAPRYKDHYIRDIYGLTLPDGGVMFSVDYSQDIRRGSTATYYHSKLVFANLNREGEISNFSGEQNIFTLHPAVETIPKDFFLTYGGYPGSNIDRVYSYGWFSPTPLSNFDDNAPHHDIAFEIQIDGSKEAPEQTWKMTQWFLSYGGPDRDDNAIAKQISYQSHSAGNRAGFLPKWRDNDGLFCFDPSYDSDTCPGATQADGVTASVAEDVPVSRFYVYATLYGDPLQAPKDTFIAGTYSIETKIETERQAGREKVYIVDYQRAQLSYSGIYVLLPQFSAPK